jgi:hypothetical protein
VVRYGDHVWDTFSVTQATQALSSGEAEFYATGSAMARGFLAKAFLQETGCAEVDLEVKSDSAAGRGICQRHGVGKVRHLELRYLWTQERVRLKQCKLTKADTLQMKADILTKYVEEEPLKRHCASMNLRFVHGLGAATMVTSAEGLGAVATRSREAGGFETWALLLAILAATLLMCCACCCGCLAHAVWSRRYKVAVSAPPASSVTTSEDAAASSSAGPEASNDMLTRLLESYTVPVLRDACRARGLPVVGLKSDVIRRLAAAEGLPTPSQIEAIYRTRTALMAKGLSYPLELEDVLFKTRVRSWLCGSAAELSRRP